MGLKRLEKILSLPKSSFVFTEITCAVAQNIGMMASSAD
jgi:hypothetical protein